MPQPRRRLPLSQLRTTKNEGAHHVGTLANVAHLRRRLSQATDHGSLTEKEGPYPPCCLNQQSSCCTSKASAFFYYEPILYRYRSTGRLLGILLPLLPLPDLSHVRLLDQRPRRLRALCNLVPTYGPQPNPRRCCSTNTPFLGPRLCLDLDSPRGLDRALG